MLPELGLALSPRLECTGRILAHRSLELLSSKKENFVETGSCYVAQAGLKLLASNDLSSLASKSTRITSAEGDNISLKSPALPSLTKKGVNAPGVLASWNASPGAWLDLGSLLQPLPPGLKGQVDLKCLISGDPPTSVSQSGGITGLSHRAWHLAPNSDYWAMGKRKRDTNEEVEPRVTKMQQYSPEQMTFTKQVLTSALSQKFCHL
ncbi:hypothetical protein AAY473_020404 [Plecturocebus cupreus]